MLHRRTVERATNSLEKRVAVGAHIAPDPDFDQLVRFERDIDFMKDRIRQAVRPNRDDRMKVMRLGA